MKSFSPYLVWAFNIEICYRTVNPSHPCTEVCIFRCSCLPFRVFSVFRCCNLSLVPYLITIILVSFWQSSGKFQPRKDQLARIAPVIIEMGCFDRVETNGGAFEQVNLLAGENPNEAVRAFCKPFNEVGIKTHMLDRGLNALRMYPVPDDVRQLMYKVKAKQGTNITRIFCGLNDVRNIIPSIKWAKEGGMISTTPTSPTS